MRKPETGGGRKAAAVSIRTAGASIAALAMVLMMDVVEAADAPPGASSCTGCHAANTAVDAMPPLGGRPQADIADKMIAFKSGGRTATIMDRIARGFSDDEIRAIAAWYAAQK